MIKTTLTVLACLLMSSILNAQQRTPQSAPQAQPDGRFTAEFQAALESGDTAQANALIKAGKATQGNTTATAKRQHKPMSISAPISASSSQKPASSTPLPLAPAPTQPAEYTCNSGNCACAGASDCVAMAPICAEGTMGCNDYGCTCQEASK